MAKSPAAVLNFSQNILNKALPAAKAEMEALKAYGKEQFGLENLEKWDGPFVGEKLRQATFNFEEEVLKPYLPLNACVMGMFDIAHKLYGLNFSEDKDIPDYHKEVTTYKVYVNKGTLVTWDLI